MPKFKVTINQLRWETASEIIEADTAEEAEDKMHTLNESGELADWDTGDVFVDDTGIVASPEIYAEPVED
jgi:hypothetical protein